MRLTRRSLLLGGGALAAATVAGQAVAKRPKVFHEATPILVEAKPISPVLGVGSRIVCASATLAFRSGLDLRSSAKEFGGFSSLWRSADGREIIALADNAQWLRARVETSEGRLSGLADAVLTPLMLAGWQASAQHAILRYREPCNRRKDRFRGRRTPPCGSFALPGTGRTFSGGAPIELPFDLAISIGTAGWNRSRSPHRDHRLRERCWRVAERSPDSDCEPREASS